MPHGVKMPDYVIQRIMAKRGKLSVFDSFEARKTALLVVDMQNFWRAFADERATRVSQSLPTPVWALLHSWYASGWITLGQDSA